jgi:hypothetical protein
MNLPQTIIILQMNTDTSDTQVMKQVIRSIFSREEIRATIHGKLRPQGTQVMIYFADELDPSGFRVRRIFLRIKKSVNLGFDQVQPEVGWVEKFF